MFKQGKHPPFSPSAESVLDQPARGTERSKPDNKRSPSAGSYMYHLELRQGDTNQQGKYAPTFFGRSYLELDMDKTVFSYTYF